MKNNLIILNCLGTYKILFSIQMFKLILKTNVAIFYITFKNDLKEVIKKRNR